MTRVTSATVKSAPLNGRIQHTIHVVLDNPDSGNPEDMIYTKQQADDCTAYLGFEPDGDLGWFCVSDRNPTGFGGRSFVLPMTTGAVDVVKGPWSSRPSCMLEIFPEAEPLVECVDQRMSVAYVKRDVLTKLGIQTSLQPIRPGLEERYYAPIV